MASGVNIILFSSNEEYAPLLRREVNGMEGVKIVSEVDDTILLAESVQKFPADVVIVDLDPIPEEVLPLAGALAMERRELAVFAVSESSDGQLILSAMRAGLQEFLTKPLDMQLLQLAVDKVAKERTSNHVQGRLLTFIGSSGGVGATTIATNLAVELAHEVGDRRVALVDLDHRFGQAATMLDLQPSFTVADLVSSSEQVETAVIQQAMTQHDSGVDVLARPNNFAEADMISAGHCAGILVALQQLYDYVVVDGPNRFDVGSKSVLDIADINFLVIQLLVPSVRNLHRIVSEMRTAGFNMDRVNILCNRVGKDNMYITTQNVEDMLNHKICFSLPDDPKPVCSAINMGVPLRQEHEKTKICGALNELAALIHRPGEYEAKEAGNKGVGGLMKKMFSAK